MERSQTGKEIREDAFQNKFSSVKVKSSPGMKSAGGLTGSSRKVKDTVADLHNLQQKWNKLNAEGSTIVSQIANIKLQTIFSVDDEEAVVPTNDFPQELEDHCQCLSTVVDKMDKLTKKAQSFVVVFRGLRELFEYQSGTTGSQEILFQTWTLNQFESTTLELVAMYVKEMKLKHLIQENICHIQDRNTMMFYIAAWVHQPYIDDNSKILLESMLVETGHR